MLKKFSRWNKSVPHYKELQSMVTEAITREPKEKIDILELGTGKGGTALALLEKFSNATYEGVDTEEGSLAVAKKQLSKFKNVSLKVDHFLNFKPTKDKYDVIVAVLAIHHLTAQEKKLMLKRVKSWLKKDGILIIGDLLKLADPAINEKGIKVFSDYRQASLSKEELQEIKEHVAKDPHIIETFEDTRKILQTAGFKTLDVIWSYYRMAVIRAK